MTATITERPTQTAETTATATTTQATTTNTQAEANRLTFAVAMIAVTVMAVVGAVTGIPTLMFASSVLAAITMGVGIYAGVNLLQAR